MRLPLLLLLALTPLTPTLSAATLDIGTLGARPDDAQDDTAAFKHALAQAQKNPGTVLTLSRGQYDLATRQTPPDGSAPPLLVVKNAQDLTIDGHGATLVCHDFATLFFFENCRDLVIRNLNIDYDPLPFTAGELVNVTDKTADLQVAPPQKALAGMRVESLLPYDPAKHRIGAQIRDDLYQPDSQTRTKIVAPGVIRFDIARPLFKSGNFVILRHQIYSKNALDFTHCDRVTLENVTVYTAPGMALHADQCSDVTLSHFNVTPPPGSGRWFTCTADATHLNNCRGTVTLDHCTLEMMGDDGANVHNFYLRVRQHPDPSTIVCELGKDPHWEPTLPHPGDQLEIGSLPDPLLPYVKATVASVSLDPTKKFAIIKTTTPLPDRLKEWDVVGNASALPHLVVRDCLIRRNRARGVLVQTRHALVENNTFEDISGAAIQVTCDASFWWEGMTPRDVTLRNNTIRRDNFGIAARDAAIDVFADVDRKPAPDPVLQQITITGNTISDIPAFAIHIGSAADVTVTRNTLHDCAKGAVRVNNSRDVTITNNTATACPKGVEIPPNDHSTVKSSGNTGF